MANTRPWKVPWVNAVKLSLNGTQITATAAEINQLAGATATAAEITKLNGVAAGTVTASKALVAGAARQLDELWIENPHLGSASDFWYRAQLRIAPSYQYEYFEDFMNVPVIETTHVPAAWAYSSDTANDACTFPAACLGGVLQVATGAGDNNETYLQLCHVGTAENFKIANASTKKLWFEVRVKALEHADEGIFIGLAEPGSAAGNFLADDSGAIADKDHVGFRLLTDASAEWDVAWRKNGQAQQEIANVVANADDWHTFSFYFDGTNTVTFYIDGTANGTTALANAGTFPGGEEMNPIIAIKTGEGVAKNVQIDYIKIVQLR